MKKIININLSGMVIPIEDSAYEKLQDYIESLRRYFAKEEGRDEIINDIETRIAELMNDKIKKGAAAVTDADMDAIIISMGRIEDFETADLEGDSTTTQNNNQKSEYTYSTNKSRGRLYRDWNDKYIAGVCSGIANYLNVDPAIIRIIFLILLFAGGGGLLAYIILWIVLPAKDLDNQLGKRLYRNPDDRVLGGVAGGMAAYFNKSARTIRLIFAAPILLTILFSILNGNWWGFGHGLFWNIGFGSLSSTFILVYIILWIILPEAVTPYEKMEMHGETVDVNRIRQNVREGMGPIKERMKEWGEEVKESAQNLSNKAKEFSSTRGRAFAGEVNETVRRRSGGIGHAIAVLFKVFFLFIAGCIAFGLFMGLLALVFGGVAWWPINNFLWTSKWQMLLAWGTLIFFFIVPLAAFITWIIRRLAKVRAKKSYLGWVFGGLWAIGWIVMVLFVASISKDFREFEHSDTTVNVTQPANGKMIVAVSQPELEYTGNFGWIDDNRRGWDLSSDTMRIAAIKFNVNASTDDKYHVTIKRYGFGRSQEDAVNRAEKIQFSAVSRDSVLDLANSYSIDRGSKFRFQHVEMEILVPVGKKIRFDESIREKLNSFHVKIKRNYRRNRISSFDISDDNDFYYRTGVDYVMGIDGKLKSADGSSISVPEDNNYRYPGTDSMEIEKSIEQKKTEIEELERRKKEIKNDKQVATINIVTKNNEGPLAGGPSPASTMAQWF